MRDVLMESMYNLKSYLDNMATPYKGEFTEDEMGGYALIFLPTGFYDMRIMLDDEDESAFLDVKLPIKCQKPYISAMHSYASSKMSEIKIGRIVIDNDTGDVFVRVETAMVDRAVTKETFWHMQKNAFRIVKSLESSLSRIAVGCLLLEESESISEEERVSRELEQKVKKLSFSQRDEQLSFFDTEDKADDDKDDILSPIEDDDEEVCKDDNESKEEEKNSDKSFDELFPSDDDDDDDDDDDY